MSEETPETEPAEEKPKRRRRRKAAAGSETPATEASTSSEPRREAPKQRSGRKPTRVARDEEQTSASAEEADRGPEAAEAAEAESSTDVAPQAEEEQEPVTQPEAEEPEAEPEGTQEAEAEAAPAAPAATAPTTAPRRRRGRGAPLDVEVRAQAKYVRSSARKARLVCDHIRGKSVEEARAILAHTPRAIARDWSKLLESAVANAEHNHELIGEDLYVKAVRADEGPTIKRYRPRALGRATRIRKRTSHLTISLKQKQQ